MSFRDRLRCRIVLATAIPVIPIVFFMSGLLEMRYGFLAMCILLVADLVVTAVIWHCPYCERSLPWSNICWWNMKHCPNCGAQLSESEDDHRPR